MNLKRALTLAAWTCGALYLGYLSILYLMQGPLIYPGTKNRVDSVTLTRFRIGARHLPPV